jgi:hypothetical protein
MKRRKRRDLNISVAKKGNTLALQTALCKAAFAICPSKWETTSWRLNISPLDLMGHV